MYIKPKKSLGQNFLIDKNIQNKIISACNLTPEDIVLEIGSGRGDLTARLAQNVRGVYTLEIDRRLNPLLEQALSNYSNYQIIKSDILKFDLNKFIQDNKIKQKIKVIGNIPYYISSPIIEYLIGYRRKISAAFITVQKEFGRRMGAHPGSKEYGSFSCFVQYYCACRIIFDIKKNSFKPAPNVDSCFLSLIFRDKPVVLVSDEAGLFKLIRTAFNQRRKTLRNSLEGLVAQDRLKHFLQQAGINQNVRPEDLSLEEFAGLSNYLSSSLNHCAG
ncbi:MAG: ribosomal RNA small subunit methyltransferase A [Candidatus Omnitrophica bacterium CG11_big_fil_rev_8_21_14_0_20_43_6]|nr:MAG: ribosomal RNA small subunit methyltransferase A [Candidatus Omnitrophica bacterium CG11_big_fil_rev_8_21_14_0_20_43_6]